ncbi:hypothetical protein BVG19_g1734 [[Candida] boidinii]|nr:hypothetical protein BVG19_g1734 [[Candida] boidinii]OWB50061.1 hypothetical protein B5S27_g1607 [[Candida] boidinii]
MRSLPSPRYSIYRTFKRLFRSFLQLLSVGNISNSHNKQLVKINNKKSINNEISGSDTNKISDDRKLIRNTQNSYFIDKSASLQLLNNGKTGSGSGGGSGFPNSASEFNSAPLKFVKINEIDPDFNFMNSKKLSMKRTTIRRTKFLKRVTSRSKIHIKLSNTLVSSIIEIVNHDPAIPNISKEKQKQKQKQNRVKFKRFKSKRKLFSTVFKLMKIYA